MPLSGEQGGDEGVHVGDVQHPEPVDPRSAKCESVKGGGLEERARLVALHQERARPDILRLPEGEGSEHRGIEVWVGLLQDVPRERRQDRCVVYSVRVRLLPPQDDGSWIRHRHTFDVAEAPNLGLAENGICVHAPGEQPIVCR